MIREEDKDYDLAKEFKRSDQAGRSPRREQCHKTKGKGNIQEDRLVNSINYHSEVWKVGIKKTL